MNTNNSSIKKNVTIFLESNYSEVKTVELGQSINFGSPISHNSFVNKTP